MRVVTVTKRSRKELEDEPALTPADALGRMWQVTLDAWAFKDPHFVESPLQRHVVVLRRRKG
jgi:hypothetical protein